MKKIALHIAQLLALSLALTGCGKKNAESESASEHVNDTQANKLIED